MVTFAVLLMTAATVFSPVQRVSAQNPQTDPDAGAYLTLLGSKNSDDKLTQNPRDRRVTIDDLEPAARFDDPVMALPADARTIAQSTCRATIVVAARPVNAEPVLNAAETWLLTRYQLELVEVLKGRTSLKGATHITYVHPSGTSAFKRKQISTVVTAYPPLELNEEYLLFLERVAETGHYRLAAGAPVLRGQADWSPHSDPHAAFARKFKRPLGKGEMLSQVATARCGGAK